MVVQARRLTVDEHRGEPRGEERGQHRQRVQRHDRDQAGQQPGRDQVGHRMDRHRFDGVDLLGHPHRAELGGCARADRGGQGDTGDHRCHDAHVEERRQEAGQGLDADVAERANNPCTAIAPPEARVRKAATPTVPPIITRAPAPMVISATSRMVSLR